MDGPSAIADLKWLGMIMVFIWVAWFLSGGPARYEASNQGVLLKPPSPLSTGETYGQPPKIDLEIPDTINVPLFGARAILGSKINIRATEPQKEYFEIVGQSDTPVNITGWRLVGKKGVSATIGQGARVFLSGQVNTENDIYLAKGDRATMVSGSSPVGYSFRINSCSGYLSQFQNFSPKLKNVCPSIADVSSLKDYPLNSTCLDYVNKMPLCETPVKTLPTSLSAVCREFILTHASYNSCVADNKNNSDFYSNEWIVYLGKSSELWEDHDTIKFYAKDGTLIGTYTY